MLRYYNVFFSIIIWLYAYIFIKPKRIKQLLPAGLLSALILYCTSCFFGTIGAYGFVDPYIPVFGIPFFIIVWGVGIGIVVMHYMPKEFYKKNYYNSNIYINIKSCRLSCTVDGLSYTL
jgi:hypothetical protein